MLHATARSRPLALALAMALLLIVPRLAFADAKVTYVPVQAGYQGALRDKADPEAVQHLLPYAEGRVLVQFTETGIAAAPALARANTMLESVGILTGLPDLDAALIEVQATDLRLAHAPAANFQKAHELGLDRWFILEYTGDIKPTEMKERFSGVAVVENITPDWRAFLMVVPPDPMHPMHWGHNNTGQLLSYDWDNFQHETGSPVGDVGFDTNAQDAWSGGAGFGSASTIIAILDTGVDAGHPDIPQMAGYDFGDNDSNPDDDSAAQGHGTACSGVAAASTNNLGTAGIAAGCTIMPLKVADSGGSLFFTSIQNALIYAADNGAHVASMSFGAGIASDPATDATLEYAWDNGVVLLAATGNANDSVISYPAIHPDVIGVGAASPCTERKRSSSNTGELNPGVFPDPNGYSCDGERWWGSNYGSTIQDDPGAVDVIAPTILPTTDIQGAGGYDPSDYSKWFNGTSCATPYAAGVCGLIRSATPGWTNAQIRQQLLESAQDVVSIESAAGWDRYTGYGMVDAYEAAASGPNPNPPANITAVSTCAAPTDITLNWDDPTIHGDGTPLGDFEILVSRDGTPIGPVDQGIETITDSGLTPGQLYMYTLQTHDQDTDSMSVVVSINKYAGGDPNPSPPGGFSVTAIAGPAFDLDWTNPSVNVDGSPLCDFAGVNVYRNGSLYASIPYNPGDIGTAGTYTDNAPQPGLNCYKLTATDSEIPSRESGFSAEICVEVPLDPPFNDCFEIAGPPDAGKWTTGGVVVDGLASNPPTPPNAADLDGGDVLTSRAIDMSTSSGSGYVFLYQKEQTGNAEAPDPANDLVIEFYNSDGVWDEVGRHLGADADETSFTTHILALDSLVPSSGTYFHTQFRARFRNTGDATFDNWFVDCVALDIPSCNATMTVAPVNISDALVAGDPTGAVVPITVTNSCAFNALNWAAAENPDVSWLVLTSASGSISGSGSQNFTATFNAIGMTPGVYNTSIDVTSNDPVNPLITVAVTLTVNDAPDIDLSPDSIVNTLSNLDPAAHDMVTISNTGTGPLSYSVLDAASGSAVQPGVTPTAKFVGVRRADGTVLPVGSAPAPTVNAAKAAWYKGELGDGLTSAERDASLSAKSTRVGLDRPSKMPVDVPVTASAPRNRLQPYAQGGPDGAGYRWIDSDEANGPVFNWVDISGIGTNTGITGDDENLGPFALGFTFNHYGSPFVGVRVASNGFLSFSATAAPYINEPIPSGTAPFDLVAPFWDDFNPSNAGTIYYYQDVANDRFIVQYDAVSYYADDFSSNTYQVIINKDGTIIFQYLDVDAPSNSATVGLQNGDGSIGIQVVNDGAYLHNELAVLFYQDAAWLSATPTSGNIGPGDSAMLDVESDPAGLPPGSYFGNVLVQSNDPDEAISKVHVQLNVTGTGAALPFCDDFNTGASPDAAKWTNSGVVLNATGIGEPSAPTSADLNQNDVMTSIQLDLSAASGTGKTLVYYQEAGGGGEPPDAGNDLIIEFKNSDGIWDQVDRVFGAGTAAGSYSLRLVDLDGLTPSTGTYFYGLFQMRVRTTGDAASDDWFVDDLCLADPPCAPSVTVNPTAVCDTLVAGSVGDPIDLNVGNTCGFANLVFNIVESPDQPWLTVVPTNGVVSGATSTSVQLTFDATGMLPGTYNTTLFVTSNDPVNPSVPVSICLRVTGAPHAEVDPDSICPVIVVFNGPVIHRAASISNTGVVPLTWRLSDTQGIPASPNQLDPASTRRSGDSVPNAKKLELFKEVKDLVMPEYEPGTVGDDPEAKGYRNPFLGGLQPYGQGGPDAFGYRWIDSDQAGGPEFGWIELQGNGGIDTGLHADDVTTAPIALGFTFPFYGTNFTAIRACSNGWLSFTSTATAFTNTALPNTAQPNNTIAPLWDDYDMRNGVGTCYYRSDVALGRFIVEWKKVTRFNALSDTLTFQAVLCKDGSITYNYLSVKGLLNSNTIGIENAAGTTGLQVVFNANYVHSGLSVLIQNEQEWLSATPTSGTIPPGGTQLINVAFDPTGVAIGVHRGFLRITTNDPILPKATIPICMDVEDAVGVALSRFEAISTPDGVRLDWATSDETDHAYFDVFRAEGPSEEFVQVNPAPITGRNAYEFVDGAVLDGSEYRYQLEAVDRFGGRVTYGPVVVTFSGRPAVFNLVQNYPNPFRGNTTFLLAMPAASDVRLRIFDAAGRLVRSVHEGAMEAGRHTFEWNGRDDAGQSAAAGFYFLRAESTVGTKVVRMMLVK